MTRYIIEVIDQGVVGDTTYKYVNILDENGNQLDPTIVKEIADFLDEITDRDVVVSST